MNTAAEQYLQATILPQLELGRRDWDRPHTERVVYYAEEIAAHTPELQIDGNVLIPAAYGHDWGYTGLFPDGAVLTGARVRLVKPEHMRRSAEKMEEILEDPVFDYLNPDRKDRICHLVLVHDMVPVLEDPDELVLMEADTLAAFDSSVPSTYGLEDKQAWMAKAIDSRVSRFITTYSKRKVIELVVSHPVDIGQDLMEKLVEMAGDSFLLEEPNLTH
jgi:hypothetical protein